MSDEYRQILNDYLSGNIEQKTSHGTARWPKLSELIQAGFFPEESELFGGESILLGIPNWNALEVDAPRPQSASIVYRGNTHILTVAPNRSGKGASHIIPTMLRYQGTIVCFDPKSENAKIAGLARITYRGTLPFELSPLKETTNSINVIEFVKRADQARIIAECLYDRDQNSSGGSRYYDEQALNFLTGVILFLALEGEGEERTIGGVRDAISHTSAEEFRGLCEAMQEHSNRTISGAGRALLDAKEELSKEVKSSLHAKLAIWDDEGLRAATNKTDIPLGAITGENGPTEDAITIYIQVPFSHMDAFAPFTRLMFTFLMNASQTEERQRLHERRQIPPILFLLDEFAALGRMENISKGMSYMSGYGVRMWFFVQKLSQLQTLYPQEWRGFMEDCGLKIFMDNREPETLKMLSDWLGNETVSYDSGSFGSSGYSSQTSYTSAPLVSVDDMNELLNCKFSDENNHLGCFQLVISDRARPLVTKRPYYFISQLCQAIIDTAYDVAMRMREERRSD